MHPNTSWRGFLIWAGTALTLGFALLKPESSDGLGFFAGILFWGAHVFGGLVLLEIAQVLTAKTPAGRWPTGVQLVLGGLLGAAAFTPLALGLDQVSGMADVDDDSESLLGEFMGSAALLVLTWLALNALRMLRLPEFTAHPQVDGAPDFFEKVPPELGRDLISLQAELHYLRVRTIKGDALILYPFGQAVAQLDGAHGQQVHRSFWVSFKHVTRLEKRGQGGTAAMSDGSSANVSRAYFSQLKAALQSVSGST